MHFVYLYTYHIFYTSCFNISWEIHLIFLGKYIWYFLRSTFDISWEIQLIFLEKHISYFLRNTFNISWKIHFIFIEKYIWYLWINTFDISWKIQLIWLCSFHIRRAWSQNPGHLAVTLQCRERCLAYHSPHIATSAVTEKQKQQYRIKNWTKPNHSKTSQTNAIKLNGSYLPRLPYPHIATSAVTEKQKQQYHREPHRTKSKRSKRNQEKPTTVKQSNNRCYQTAKPTIPNRIKSNQSKTEQNQTKP